LTARTIAQDTWVSIRLLHLRQGKSQSWIARELGVSRNTVSKYLKDSDAPKYRTTKPRGRPIADKWEEHVRDILEDDRNAPRKQKHTAKRIFDRLVAEHQFTGAERTVRKLVADIKNKPAQKASLPLQFAPGKDAQVDFGESYIDLAGVRTKVQVFEMRLNYSRKKFVMAVMSANMESFMEAHVRAFESNFCTPGIEGAHEKGGVEGGIGYRRRNWLVPVPKVTSVEELNTMLLKRCIKDGDRVVDGQQERIAEAFSREKVHLLALPERRFDPGTARNNVIADSYQIVIYNSNRYSVPHKYVGRPRYRQVTSGHFSGRGGLCCRQEGPLLQCRRASAPAARGKRCQAGLPTPAAAGQIRPAHSRRARHDRLQAGRGQLVVPGDQLKIRALLNGHHDQP
jgi:transposase